MSYIYFDYDNALQLCEHNIDSPWTIVTETDMNEPYAYDFNFGNTWCSYDNPDSMAAKVRPSLMQ